MRYTASAAIAAAILVTLFRLASASPEPTTPRPSTMATLIDVEKNIRLAHWSLDARTAGDAAGSWSVRKDVLHGGRQEGVDRVVVDNGELSFTVIPTRGMDVWDARAGDVSLAWDSPVKEIVHPQYVQLDSRGGLGWLEGFGAWMCRCGLASNGAPGEDIVPSNTGAPVPVQLSLHGKISYVPARFVGVEVSEESPRTITVKGVVDETMMYGTQLRMETSISTVAGSRTLTIRDVIVNLSHEPQEFQMLYHANYGAPLLEKGARVVAPAARVAPRDPRAAEGVDAWDSYLGPTKGYTEQVYFLELYSDGEGKTEVLLKNRAGDRGTTLRFAVAELPFLTVWKNTHPDGYVTGIEPGTNFPNLRKFERSQGRTPKLAGGDRRALTVEFTALTNAEEVRAAETRIEAIRGGRPTRVDAKPQPDWSPVE